MLNKYYFETINPDYYATVWYGFFEYDENNERIPISDDYYQKSNRDLDDLLVNVCDIHYYVNLLDNYIYLSIDNDSKYYYYQFEKNIKNTILSIEEKFKINIKNGEFNAIEYRPNGNQYKYTISREYDSTLSHNKVKLKKKILNWDSFKNKKNKSSISNISDGIKNLKM
jgi:hypothetical protein